ncbi:MAG: hypothetical protein WBA74_10930 [Cyclobacteriaceae bacterium]
MMELSDQEIIILNKILFHVKFKSESEDAVNLSNSPFINTIYDKVIKAYEGIYQVQQDYKNQNKADLFVANELIIEGVKFNISNIEGWNNFDDGLKEEIVKGLLYPYKTTDEIFQSLVI